MRGRPTLLGVAKRTFDALLASGHPSTPEELLPAFQGTAPTPETVASALVELRRLGVARELRGRWRLTQEGRELARPLQQAPVEGQARAALNALVVDFEALATGAATQEARGCYREALRLTKKRLAEAEEGR